MEPKVPPGKGASAEGKQLVVHPAWTYTAATDEEKNSIHTLKRLMDKDLSLHLTVTGHTDTIGAPDQNRAIGYFYARQVALELEKIPGFQAKRLTIQSAGESSPLTDARGYRSQSPNRRVVISLSGLESRVVHSQPQPITASGKILILEPSPGVVGRAYQRVRAVVEGGSTTALLTVNGISTLVAVQDSRIESEAVLSNGENIIEVMAWDVSGDFGKDQVEVTYRPPPPEVDLIRPREGDVFNTTSSPVIEVAGRIRSATPLKEGFLFLNDTPRMINLDRDGSFAQPVVLLREDNRLMVEVLDVFGKTATSSEISVATINMSPKDLVVYLTWDRSGIDLDLHVWGPGGKHTYYNALDPYESAEAIPGGGLDLDDRDGFGPEVFSLSEGDPGVYKIGARYHHSLTGESCRAKVTVVFHPADPARRVTRVFGPVAMSPGSEAEWIVTRISLPEEIFLER